MSNHDDAQDSAEEARARDGATPDLPGKSTKSGKAMIGMVIVIVLIIGAMIWWASTQFQGQEFEDGAWAGTGTTAVGVLLR